MTEAIAVNSENDIVQHGYYRSHMFTANSGINPLITAAQPLISLCHRLLQAQAMRHLKLMA